MKEKISTISYTRPKKITLRQLLQCHQTFENFPYPDHILHGGKLRDFYITHGKSIHDTFEAIQALQNEYMKMDNGAPLMESITEEKEKTVTKEKGILWWKKTVLIPDGTEKIETGKKCGVEKKRGAEIKIIPATKLAASEIALILFIILGFHP